ncbi:MAG: serine/threonine-protein kinase [Planctomycetota bacterium]
MAEATDEELPPHLTEIFHRYVRSRDQGEVPDVESLLDEAGEAADDLRARIDRYETMERAADLLSRRRAPHQGHRLGRFEVLSSLGAGGLAHVYLARDPKLGRRVALKVLATGVALDDDRRKWMLREARSLARLEHPNVLRVFEVSDEEDGLVVVTEHLSGPTLAQVLAHLARLRDGETSADDSAHARRIAGELLPFSARAALLERLARALAYCHDMGILHRDVKPANVVFDARGTPKLIDFGLAHLEDAEEETNVDITVRMMGTPSYLAPEQVDSEQTGADPRSDQFSFGILAYELLALRSPFQRATRNETLNAISHALPRAPRRVDPSIPPDLERVVLHALERSPADRYPSLAAVADDLGAAAAHRPISLAEPTLGHALTLWLRRNRRAVGAGGTLAFAALLAVLVQWWLRARSELDRILEQADQVRVEELRDPVDFRDSFGPLFDAKTAAERFRGSALRRLVFRSARDEVQTRIDAWSARLAQVLHQGVQPDEGGVVFFQHTPWKEILALESRLNVLHAGAGSRAVEPFRDRGRVLLPWSKLEGLQHYLFTQSPLTEEVGPLQALFTFRRLTTDETLDPGVYRLVAWDGSGNKVKWEAEFALWAGWEEPIELRYRPPQPLLFAEATAIERARVYLSPFLSPEDGGCDLLVPSVRLLPRLITATEFRAFAQATGRPLPTSLADSHEDVPAWVSPSDAMEFARWAGGRLPTAWELWVAERRSPGWLPASGPGGNGEWVGDYSLNAGIEIASKLNYESLAARGTQPSNAWLNNVTRRLDVTAWSFWTDENETRQSVGTGFRVAFTTDSLDALLDSGILQDHLESAINLTDN